jgi:hypothetical protein
MDRGRNTNQKDQMLMECVSVYKKAGCSHDEEKKKKRDSSSSSSLF